MSCIFEQPIKFILAFINWIIQLLLCAWYTWHLHICRINPRKRREGDKSSAHVKDKDIMGGHRVEGRGRGRARQLALSTLTTSSQPSASPPHSPPPPSSTSIHTHTHTLPSQNDRWIVAAGLLIAIWIILKTMQIFMQFLHCEFRLIGHKNRRTW